MKKLFTLLIALVLCTGIALSLASCEEILTDVQGAIDEATAPLKETIATLEETKTELEGAKATLETAKAELEEAKERLEAEKKTLESEKADLIAKGEENTEKLEELEGKIAELDGKIAALEDEKTRLAEKNQELEEELALTKIQLACAKDEHVWDGESLVRYDWNTLRESCTAFYNCMYCDEEAYEEATNVTTGEDGALAAEFETFPSDTFAAPVFTGVSFNTDSPAYSPEEGMFYVTEENPLIVSFTGEGLHRIGYGIYFRIGAYCEENWTILAYTFDSEVEVIDENTITYTFDYHEALNIVAQYGSADGFAVLDSSYNPLPSTSVFVTAKPERPELDEESYMLVKTEEELRAALAYGGRVRLGADIVGTGYLTMTEPMLFDFAGHSLTSDESYIPYSIEVSLYDCTFIDSVGGSYTNYSISSYGRKVEIKGDISFNEEKAAVIGSGSFDLSEYTGGELIGYRTLSSFEITLPEGYALYDMEGNKYLSLADMPDDAYYVYVKLDGGEDPVIPNETEGDWTMVYTAEELIQYTSDTGKIRLANDISLGEVTVELLYDVTIDLNGYTVSTSEWVAFYVYEMAEVTIMNGTVKSTAESGRAVLSAGYLTVDNCSLIGNEYYALSITKNETTVKNSTLAGGVDITGSTASTPILDATEGVTVVPSEKFGISVDQSGSATFSFDPTEMLDIYNAGTLRDNEDGTYTLYI